MRKRDLVRSKTLVEILESQFRTEQLFKDGTNENRKNGELARELVLLYASDKDYFMEMVPAAEGPVVTYLQEREMGKVGTMKMPVSFNTRKTTSHMAITFAEPKMKVVEIVKVKEVELGKKKSNKKSLW